MLHFELPSHLIAQHPSQRRDQSRLLVVDRKTQKLHHKHFVDLPELLQSGDLLIGNDTKVLPARLLGQRDKTGGKWEGLFLGEREDNIWEMLCQTRGRLIVGETVSVSGGQLKLKYLGRDETVSLWQCQSPGTAVELLDQYGHMPLPPYIRKGIDCEEDRQRYQTIYAANPGAVAAPTAGLHFTDELFAQLTKRHIEHAFITLHVGWGTFAPIKSEDYREHKMHCEWGELREETVNTIERCRKAGGRVIGVGTTTVRVLETVAGTGPLRAWNGETDIYIYPPYQFRAIDGLITNFHLPGTTLLLLVEALLGRELLAHAYQQAIDNEYRFYSYGDAMLIL